MLERSLTWTVSLHLMGWYEDPISFKPDTLATCCYAQLYQIYSSSNSSLRFWYGIHRLVVKLIKHIPLMPEILTSCRLQRLKIFFNCLMVSSGFSTLCPTVLLSSKIS